MKKYLFALIIQVVISLSFVSAQSDHMIFRNVPIDGSLSSFIEKMQDQGFTLEYNKDDSTFAKMEGVFINLNCEFFILATPKSHIVWKVAVKLPENDDWYSLKSDYFKYKKEFQKKYGGNETSYEFFSKPYYEGDGYELQALKKGKCTYTSFFETSNGNIMVGISKLNPKIEFVYEDEINSELKDKETKDKIQDDI